MREDDWAEEFPAAITVCDERGVILSMNRAADEVFRKDGGRALVGKSLLDCHPEPARSSLADMLKSPRANTYTVEKGSVKKLIHQAPWHKDGRFAGLVELSIVLPERMAHHVRKEKKIMSVAAGITRAEAWSLLQEHVKNPNMLKHCLASEAVMRAAARRLGQDEEVWGLAGLLHDLDVELTGGDLKVHGLKTVEMLAARGVAPEIVDAIKMHNEVAHGIKRSTVFHRALAACETITGLVTAATLVYPDKKLASVKPSSVVKRMKEKSFAASVDRDIIRECEAAGIPLPEFAELAVGAMRVIAADLGL